MKVKVSVVIPVYNAEKYLVPCIRSLLAQTLDACEFLFVNDGSSDGSRRILEEYAGKDGRIRLLHQINQGVSAARNAGLRAAVGTYIGFVDADDTVATDMFETLYEAALREGCDAVVSQFESELEGHRTVTRYPFPAGVRLDRAFIEREIEPYFLKSDQLNTACCKLYKRELIQAAGVQFPHKVELGEDGLFNRHYFRHAGSMVYLDYTGYRYREVEGSATRNLAAKNYFQRALDVYEQDKPDAGMSPAESDRIQHLRSVRLITSVMSYVYVYFKPSNGLSLPKRFRHVAGMIAHPLVREALPYYFRESYAAAGRYDRAVAVLIRLKSAWGLYCAAAYSRRRNKIAKGA